MTLPDRILFAPLIPVWALALLAAIALIALVFYALRGGGAPILRGLGIALVLAALAQPLWVRETREPTSDIAAVIIDQSASLAAAGRLEPARVAGQEIARQLAAAGGVDVRVREVTGDADGTPLIGALEDALADAPRDRIAGAILISDGQISDPPADARRLRDLGPVHALIVGDPDRGDRRLELIAAPAFGLVDAPIEVEGVVHDTGARGPVRITATIDGRPAGEIVAELNTPFRLALTPPKRGPNLVQIEAEPAREEISLANNRAAFSVAGVRDRLRVLLVTGEPYPGARVWRNLLKGDPAVDLVHFTIMRPPDKLDATPNSELALIEFPTNELFVEKLDRFDLIIFDRYRPWGILLFGHFARIAQHVESGGALLVAAGPQDASVDSLFATPLAGILPSQPTLNLIEQPFRPQPTALGERHPLTRGLPDPARWGAWERLVEARATGGETVLQGPDGRPLLVVDRVGQGRVAQLWSDQIWLWARGYDGGGPHGELLRRLAHWLMQEPELDEERLTIESTPEGLAVERATLAPGDPGDVRLTGPDGDDRRLALSAATPGVWRGLLRAPDAGVWQAQAGGLTAFAAVGPASVRETAALNATRDLLKPVADATGGATKIVGERAERTPEVRRIGGLGPSAGGDWIGLRRRDAYVVRATASEPLGPGWAWAIAGLLLLMLGWRREAK